MFRNLSMPNTGGPWFSFTWILEMFQDMSWVETQRTNKWQTKDKFDEGVQRKHS